MPIVDYTPELAVKVESELRRLHPAARIVSVELHDKGLTATVQEDGEYVDVCSEMVQYINRKLGFPRNGTFRSRA